MARKTIRSASTVGRIEQLEGRTMMAADVTATLSNGILSIAGTDRSDNVSVGIDSRGAMFVATPSKGTLASFDPSSVRGISASLGNGTDRININLPSRSLNAVAVNMGNGSAEACRVCVGSIGNLSVDAKAAVGTSVLVTNTVIMNQAWVDFGNGAGNDFAEVVGSQINRLSVNLGADNDSFLVGGSSSISTADVSMGSGRDFCSIALGSEIRSGTIDGGSNLGNSPDVLRRPAAMQGVRFVNFERVNNS